MATLFLDVECYKDYFLVVFLDEKTGKQASFEMFEGRPLNVSAISNLMRRNLTVGFNSNSYDLLMISAALENRSCSQLKSLSDTIITSGKAPWAVARESGLSIPLSWDHIDIIDVVPGQASLKIYAGRLGWPKLQDLPLDPGASVSPEDRKKLRHYCRNDVSITKALWDTLQKQIDLRVKMGAEYNVDLRSKSDAQIAETVLKHEVERVTGKRVIRPSLSPNATVRYLDPGIVSFKDDSLRDVFKRILKHDFALSPNGSIALPDWLKKERVTIGGNEYQMGVGGLHSCEKGQSVYAGDTHVLFDADVASYYPSIIQQQKMAPPSMGNAFSPVYDKVYRDRIEAKRNGNKIVSDTLKIVLNGSFGKLGSKYSILYAPQLLLQTTMTGQLCLLMLIERVTEAGARVVSANTDGIVILSPKHLECDVESVLFDWELDTTYELERTDYRSIHSRDVNNYIAVRSDGSTKGKGAYAEPNLMKNPQFTIVTEAVSKHLSGEKDYQDVIRESRDISKFVMLRRVTGGATWKGEAMGSTVRFYYSNSVPKDSAITYTKNGNKVPQSDGSRPVLDLPDAFPNDVEVERYVGMARMVFKQMGVDHA